MEQNNNPYEYEKPLKPRQAKRLGYIAGLSLLGVGSTFVGSAIASTVATTSTADSLAPGFENATVQDAVTIDAAPADQPTDASSIAPQIIAQPQESIDNNVSVPAVPAKPGKNSAQVSLPSLPQQDFGNVSSATPSAGGNPTTYLGGNQGAIAGERRDHKERGYESHESRDGSRDDSDFEEDD